MKTLTVKFNKASVQKDDVFEVDLPAENARDVWDISVVSGKARQLGKTWPDKRKRDVSQRFFFKAEARGEIRLKAARGASETQEFYITVK